jgi:hypothetical protein
MTSKYASFPVIATIDLRDIADIRHAVDKVTEAYEKRQEEFSFRILLPRGEKLTGKAKKLGMTFQGELILTNRKRGLVPQTRDLRYLHDEEHYGWLLASPAIFEKFEGRA